MLEWEGHLAFWTSPLGTLALRGVPHGGTEMRHCCRVCHPPSDWQHPCSFHTAPGHPQNPSVASDTPWAWKTVKLPEALCAWKLSVATYFLSSS